MAKNLVDILLPEKQDKKFKLSDGFINLGEKWDNTDEPAIASSKKEQKISYPSLYIEKPMAITANDIGKEFMATVKLKVKKAGVSINDSDKKKEYSYRFDIIEIKFNKNKD